METILMSDLYGEYLNLKEEIDAAIQGVIKSTRFIKSGKVLDFEKKLSEYLNTNVISCGNGTDALQIAFMALGLKPGDEVITTPFTFVSSVEVLSFLGLKPVFVDVESETFNMDASLIEPAISNRTRAMLPIHLFGQCCNLEAILSFCQKYNLKLVEDACQALGSDCIFKNGLVRKAGTIGDVACNSFFPSKNLGAFGDGGAVYTKDNKLAQVIRSIANHGMKKKYEYERIGVNSRLDSMQAAILEVKLKYFEDHIKKRRNVAAFYDSYLGDIEEIKIPRRVDYSSHTFHQYTIQTEKRDELQKYLETKEIPSMVYYPKPIHLQNAYGFLGYKEGDFPNAEKLSKTVLSLPVHAELKEDQLNHVGSTIKKFFKK